MPLTLLLRASDTSTGNGIPALTFDGGRIVIGRGPGCDVRLPDPSVSHRHATVRANGSDYVLVDEKSSNGTFLGAARLAPNTPRPLKHGDLLRVGRVWLEVRIDQTPATRDLAVVTRDLALALVSQAMRALGQEAETKLHVIEGKDLGALLLLREEGRSYVLGRDAGCDLPLADTDVSRTHVQIVRRGGTVLVRDLGSKNGAWLGEARIPPDRDVPWRVGTTLRIGATMMALEDPAASALAELEEAEDAPIAPEDIPPVPLPTLSGPVGGRRSTPPVADLEAPPRPSRAPNSSRTQGALRWGPTDMIVIFAALVILALSLVGLFWLLRA